MSENVIQTSFSAGELSPSLFARVDFAKYRSGAATMRNFFVDYRSGASTRPGTEYIVPCTTGKVRLIRFQQSVDVTYVLVFGDHYLRFITQGAAVVEPAIPINNIDQFALVTVTATNSYNQGDLLFISQVQGMPQINNRFFIALGVGGTTFNLYDPASRQGVNSTNYDPYIGGGFVQRVYTIGTPYGEDELALLKFSQNASIMNITHPGHNPHVLQLISATNWVLVPAVFGSTAGVPGDPTLTSSSTGPVSYKYAVTAVDSNNQESTPDNPAIITNVLDMRLNPASNTVSWGAAPGDVVAYNIYGTSPSYATIAPGTTGLGFMGTVPVSSNYFIDTNIAPDFSQSPPIHDNPFAGVNPAVSSYFQQRLVYANGGGQLVATFWASKVGAPYNFDISNPTQADDAITAALVSLEVNEIKSLIPMPSGLIALTTHGAWQISGGAGGVATQGGPITPSSLIATPQAYIGANDVPPILVNYDILFVQQKGSVIRDLTYNIYANIYTGNDISVLSNHLFYGHQILEWAYAEGNLVCS
jgi:hypothetical protein